MDDVTAPRWTTAPAAVLLLDLDAGEVAYANPAARELVEGSELPLPASAWEEGVGLRDGDGGAFAAGASPVERVLAGADVRDEPVTLARDGRPLPVLVTGHVLPSDGDGPSTALLVFVEPPEPESDAGLQARALAAAGWSFTISDPHQDDDPLVWVNDAFTDLTGYALEDVVGQNCRFLQGPETDADAVARIREGIAAREHRVTVLRNYRKDGSSFFNEVAVSPVFDAAGQLSHFVGVQTDVTDRVQGERTRRVRLAAEQLAREEAEAQQERFELLAEATTLLGEVSDVDDALSRLTQLLVARAGDWCRIDLRDGGQLGRWSAWSDGEGPARTERLADQRVDDLPLGSAVGDVLAGGPPRLLTPADADAVALGSGGEATALEGGSAVVVGLGARLRARGALTVARRRGGEPYSRGDVDAFVELAGRAGIALENVLLRARQRTSALELQTGLLPRLEDVPGLSWAVRYLPGDAGERVGGDWYDLFRTADGSVALSVGDVVGHDMAAAAAMSQMRASMRAFAWTFDDPAEVLRRLDELASRLEIAELTTAIYGRVVREDDGGRCFHYANAGHPPALLREADGTVRRLDDGGSTVLGLDVGERPSAMVPLPPGSVLVLYTDGLVERRGEPVDAGIDRLVAALAAVDGADAEAVAERLLAEADAPAAQDDVAALVLRVD